MTGDELLEEARDVLEELSNIGSLYDDCGYNSCGDWYMKQSNELINLLKHAHNLVDQIERKINANRSGPTVT